MEGTVHQGVLRVAVQVGLRQLPHIYIILKRLLHSNAWKHELAVQYSLYSIIDRGDNNLVREKSMQPKQVSSTRVYVFGFTDTPIRL